MLIPYQDINQETLQNLIESFILRDEAEDFATDLSLSEKSEKVLAQLKNGKIIILYSQLNESINLLSKEEFLSLQAKNQ